MRKIQTQLKLIRRKNIIHIVLYIIVAIMIGLLVLSTAGFAIMGNRSENSGASKEKYGDFEFVKYGGGWATELQGQVYYFSYLPQDVENVSVIGFYSLQDYANKPLYFVNTNVAAQEILGGVNNIVERYQEACLEGFNCTSTDLPVKNCTSNVIVFRKENNTKVWQEENCVYISGNFVRGADAFLYKILGIR